MNSVVFHFSTVCGILLFFDAVLRYLATFSCGIAVLGPPPKYPSIQHRPVADILKNIKRLMEQITESLPDCHIVISEIIKRKMKNGDENQAIAKKIAEFNKSLKSMNVCV